MMKVFKRLMTIFCTAVILCGSGLATSCGDNEKKEASTGKEFYNKNEVEQVVRTNTVFYAEQKSDYKIVVPQNSNAAYDFAASELRLFVEEASGVRLEIVSDAGLSLTETGKYISIGDTQLFKQSDMTLDAKILNTEGFKIESYGDTVVINASGENGVIYGVYGFLERAIGFRYYADNCYRFDVSPIQYMNSYKVCDIPTFQGRHLSGGHNTGKDSSYYTRMRYHGDQTTKIAYGEGNHWASLGDQSMVQQILPYDIYNVGHDGWFSGNIYHGQLCLTRAYANDKGLFDTFMANLINNYIIPEAEREVFFLGINDNSRKCECEGCTEAYGKYKESGVMVRFANKVAVAIREWQESLPNENVHKDRVIKVGFFAYIYTLDSPTVFDESTNSYTPLDPSVILEDGVFVRIATINSANMYPHSDSSINLASCSALTSWQAVAEDVAIWDYGTNFESYLGPYPDWGTIKENMLFYREAGVFDILTQLPSYTKGTAFVEMKIWLRSQLMWDVDQDPELLIAEFIENYYGEAAPAVTEYYDYVRMHFEQLKADKIWDGTIYTPGLYNRDFWSINQLQCMEGYLTKAEEQLAPLKGVDDERYETLLDRVRTETLFTKYMFIEMYTSYFTSSQLIAMIDEFEMIANKAEMVYVSRYRDTTVTDLINNWRKKI